MLQRGKKLNLVCPGDIKNVSASPFDIIVTLTPHYFE